MKLCSLTYGWVGSSTVKADPSPGRLVTRTQIYEHLFDEGDDTLSNLVEVHVSNIRKKLGRDLIETRRGMGYVVND